MININKRIKITVTGYVPQFRRGLTAKYHNANFYRPKMSIEKMYLNKYAGRDYSCAIHSFKARCYK